MTVFISKIYLIPKRNDKVRFGLLEIKLFLLRFPFFQIFNNPELYNLGD
jgi:hypothetical protein